MEPLTSAKKIDWILRELLSISQCYPESLPIYSTQEGGRFLQLVIRPYTRNILDKEGRINYIDGVPKYISDFGLLDFNLSLGNACSISYIQLGIMTMHLSRISYMPRTENLCFHCFENDLCIKCGLLVEDNGRIWE